VDWGVGQYERIAVGLEPAAAEVVGRAAIGPGERVLDVGCGNGNAALKAARAGGIVTGLDPAARLVQSARERAADEGVAATFVVGDAQELPFEDASFDVVLSVFGVIFAPDAERAAGELVRVLRPGGRALLSAWIQEGPIADAFGVVREAMAAAAPERHLRRFDWSDAGAVRAMLARHGAQVGFEEARLAFTAPSVEAFLAVGEEHHPMSLLARPVLERAGSYAGVLERMRAIYEAANEDPATFRVTSRYVVARALRAV
jgi:SAM-dependent methyltransferase